MNKHKILLWLVSFSMISSLLLWFSMLVEQLHFAIQQIDFYTHSFDSLFWFDDFESSCFIRFRHSTWIDSSFIDLITLWYNFFVTWTFVTCTIWQWCEWTCRGCLHFFSNLFDMIMNFTVRIWSTHELTSHSAHWKTSNLLHYATSF
jgi:hypothetical protein